MPCVTKRNSAYDLHFAGSLPGLLFFEPENLGITFPRNAAAHIFRKRER
jgi:hypothetical protein